MSARVARFAAVIQALLLMATLVLPALAAATEIHTDLWVYQNGDTVTVTGIDFGADELVAVVTTDSAGAVVDTGAATSDELGNFTYAFVLSATVDGIYDVTATGQSSGASASTQFDPGAVTVGAPIAVAFRNVPQVSGVSGFDVTVSGTYDCGNPCTAAPGNSIAVAITGIAGSSRAVAATSSGTGNSWSTIYSFRTSPAGAQLAVPADGSYTVTAVFTFSGSGSPKNGSTTAYFKVDNTSPTVSLLTCTPTPGSTNATSLNCSATFTEAVTGFSAASDVTIGGTSTAWTAGSTSGSGAGPYTFTLSRGAPNSEGTLTLQVVAGAAQDAAGNASAASSSLNYTIDTSAPTVTAFSCTPTPGITNQTSLNCSVTFSESVSVFQNGDVTVAGSSAAWSVTGAAGSGASYTFTASRGGSNKDGSLTLQIAAGAVTDSAGNASTASLPVAFSIDTNAPNTPSITGNPANLTTSTSATFNFSATDPLDNTYASGINHYECQIDGGGYSNCVSGVNYPALSAGPHSFQVRAVDNAGNTGANASFAWTIDLTAPSISSFTCVPAPGTTSDTTIDCSVTFSESVSGFVASSADLSIGGTSTGWAAGATSGSNAGPYTFTVSRSGSVDGSLTLQIVAGAVADVAGNASTTASSMLSYTIDTVGPTATLSCAPLGSPTNATSFACQVIFSESVTGFSSTTSDLTIGGTIPDSVDWNPLASTGTGAGPYFFTVNRTAPNKDGNLSFQIAAGAAVDSLGNGNAASNTLTFLIDTHGPVVTLNSVPTDPSNVASGSFGFTAVDPTTGTANGVNTGVDYTECQIDGGGWATCSSPAPYGPLAPGPHTFDVRGVDKVGNVGGTMSYNWTVLSSDSDGPVISISTSAVDNGNGWFNGASSGTSGIDIAVSASDVSGVASFECSVDGGPAASYDPNGDTIHLGDGEHTVSCDAEDTLGNPSNASEDFDVDQTVPTISISHTADGDNGWNVTDPVTESITASDATSGVASVDCLDGVDPLAVTGSEPDYSASVTGEGTHDLSCTATDEAGNDSDADTDTVKIDTVKPTILISHTADGDNGWNVTDPVTESITASDATSGVASVDCLDGVDPLAVTGSEPDYSASVTGEGTHDLSCTATDEAGNDSDADTDTVKIDLQDPTVSILSPSAAATTVLTAITVSGDTTDPGTGSGLATVTVNGVPATFGGGTFAAVNVPLSCGANTFTATSTDYAGRATSASTAFSITRVCLGGLTYYQPLDQSTTSTAVINTGKFGKVIPVKVTATYDLGSGSVALTDAVLAANGLTMKIGVNTATCSNGAPSDSIETFADAGSSNGGTNLFRWASGQWIYNLDTGKAPSVVMAINSCYRLDVYVVDSGGNSLRISGTGGASGNYAIFKPTK